QRSARGVRPELRRPGQEAAAGGEADRPAPGLEPADGASRGRPPVVPRLRRRPAGRGEVPEEVTRQPEPVTRDPAMKRCASTLSLVVYLAAAHPGAAAEKPLVLDVWPGKPPGDDAGKIGEEKFIQLMVEGKPYTVFG